MKCHRMSSLLLAIKKHYIVENMICQKDKSLNVCKIFPSKTKINWKFHCPHCRRYILPDKFHYAKMSKTIDWIRKNWGGQNAGGI